MAPSSGGAVGAERKRMMDLAAMEAATSSTQLTLPVSYRKFRGVAPRNYVLKAMLEGEHASIEDFLERLNEDASAVVGSAVLVDELFRALGANLVLLASGAGRYMDYEVPRVVPPPATQYRRPGDSDEPLPVALQCTKVVPVFEAVLKKPRLQAGEKAGVDRENVLRRWLCVLSHSPGASRLGVLIWAKGESDPLGVVAQALAGKATSTLLKRARFSARFICWADKHHVKAFPVSLEFLVSFLKPLAAEARNSAIREAMETVNSWNMFSELRSNKVEEVLLLEGALIEGALDKVDRNISKLELDLDGDTGFIEVRTYEHKNCRLSSGPGAVLILVAPYHGLHQKPWGAAWAEAAKAVGFDFEKGHRGPLLPRLACDYSWSGDAIDANETTTWIRALLSRLQAAEEDLTFSSHGLKATPLSWTSKAGYSERTQLVLGHHSLGPSGKTQEAYAREVQAQPLRDLAECLGAIRQGVFHPDRTKSGMIAGGATIRESRFSLAPLGRANLSPSHESFECAPEVELAEDGGVEPPDDQDLGEQEDVHEASSSESESSGESEEETHYESFGAGEAQNAIPSVNMGPDLDIFQNPKTKSLHSRAKGSTGKLICGRSLDNMKPFSGKVFSSRWLCKQCTAGRPLRDAGAMASFIAKKQGSEIMAQTLVESKAVFLERAKRVGLPQEAVDRLVAQTIDTMAKLAFAPCQPGETPTEESLSALIKVGGAAPPLGSIAAVRHLVFEAQTLLVSQTKALVENKENEVKELAPAERRERIRAQANKLRGITMSGQTECSYASYDLCMKLLTDNCISYLSPAKFITREAELRSEKPRKELDVQASTLVVRDRDPDQSCDTSTALSLHHAMHRRSLALDLIGVTDYFRVQGFVDFLLGHLHQEPIAGSRATSVQQILHADRAAWMRLAELTPDGIRRDAAGALPLDSLWARLQTDPKVIFHLLPGEGGALKRESTELKPEPTDTPTKKQRKGTGKGKTKTLREPSNLPEELKGLSSWTKTGKRRCWGFNMASGCPNAKAMGHFPSTTLWFADGDFGLAPAEAYRQRGSREQVAAALPPSGGRPGAGADAELVTQPAAGEIEEDAELAGPPEVEATNHGDAALPWQPDKEPPSPASPCLLGNMFSKTGPFGAPSESVDFLGGPLGATAQGGSAIEQSCGTDFLGGPIWTVPQAHAYPSASVDHVQPVQQSLPCLPVCVQVGLPALQRCFAFLQGVRVGEAKHPGRRAPADEPMLCVCHDWKRGCRLGEASHPGPGFNLDLGNLGDSLGDSIMKSIKEQIQKAVDEAIKQALASLNLGRGLAAARPSGDPDVQLEPKGRRKRKRKAKQATSHPGGNPDTSGSERAGGRQSAAKGKGKPEDKSGPAKVAQRGGPGDSGQRRGKGKGGCGEAGGQEVGDGWQIVRRKAPEGAFKLRKSDWDAPVVEYAALAEFIDKADASKVLELVVFVSADQVTLATNILRGSGLSFKALLVFLSKDEEAQRIPGTIGDRLVFRTAKVQKLTSAGASGHAPQPTGLSQTSIKIKPTESAVVYFKVPKQFASADTWKAFGGNASKAAVDWVAAHRIKVLDTFAWVLEKQRNADIEGILAHSGKDGVFVDAARTSGPRAKLQWIEKLPGEKVDAYFERALRQASSLGLVVNGGRLAWRSAMAAGEATVRIWHIDGVPHEWDADAVGQLLATRFTEYTILSHRRTRLGSCFRFRGQPGTADTDLVPFVVEHQEKPLSLWATLAPFRVVSKKQKPLASKAVPVVALEQPVVTTIVKPPTGELATGEDGKEVPQQKRVKQEVRTKPASAFNGLVTLGPITRACSVRKLVEHMRRHATQYEKEWDGKGPDSEPVKDRDFSAYLTLMEKEGAYCSDVELRALGRVLDIKIVVLPAGLNFSPYAFHSKAAKMLVLWYEDNHVDLMLPPQGHKKYPSEYAQITAGPVFGLRAGGRGPPSVFTASSAACVRSQPSSQWTSVMDGEGAKSQARPASVWTTSMPASASGSAAGRPSIEAQPSLQARRPRSQVSQARSPGSRVPSQAKVQAPPRPCPLSTVELCTSSVFTCASTGTIEAFDESEFERARAPPKRCPWLAHATAPADLTFRCNLCPYKRKATSNHQYYHIRHNHYQRAHEGQGLQPDIGRPKLTRVCGPRAQFIWCCPFCNKGITHETRKDLSRFSYYALRNQHRAQAHPEVSKAEWQRLVALPQTGPKDRQVHAKGCRQRNLTKAVFAQVRTPRFGDQMQLFVWPRARCEKRSTRVKHVLLEHGWKCLRCGECTRDLAAAKQHSEGRCKSQSNTQKRIQKLDAIEAWARRAGGAPCCRGCQACHLHANPLLAVFIKLLSINANRTAISKVDLCADFLQSCGAELLSLQEADINPLSAHGFGERWRAHGYRAVLSDIDAAKGVHRVALVASLPMHRVNLKLPPHVAARCAAGAFEMQAAGSKCITLVVAFYGFPGQPAATAQALGEVRRAAATFGGPYILLGDFNVDQSEQAVVQLLCDGELRSLDEADWTQAGPTNPTRTRRIDFGLAHWSIIATAVKQFERPNLSDHGCVFYETRCLSRADSFSMPKFRELPATATEDILSNFGRVWDAAHFESSIAGGALDEAWAFLSDVAERTLGATSLFDASGARRSDHWLPCARHESHHRVGPQGHESQSLRSSRKLLGQLHQLRQQPHCQKLWRAVGRRAGLLRATFPDIPVIHAANLAGATQVISHLHAELQQQETEARVHRWRRRVEEDPSRALAWVKRKADHQLAMEQSPQAHAGVPSSVHPASIVEEHGKVWLQHWKPESPVNFDAVQRILDRVPGGPQSDIVLQVEAEALMRATKAMRGKAMGPDRWSAELLLRLPVPWWEAAATLWNAVLSTKYVPRLWRRALIALVPKRLDEYRPIALCPVIWRAGAHCISRNVLPWMDTWLGHHTLGGAPCRGPGDAHARLFHAWQSGGKVFCQQDLTRFFDSLDVKAVGMVLRHLGAPAGLAELLASFYQDASRLFLHEGRSSSAWGSPARGLAQGCPLSPMAAVAVGHIWAMWVQSFAKGLLHRLRFLKLLGGEVPQLRRIVLQLVHSAMFWAGGVACPDRDCLRDVWHSTCAVLQKHATFESPKVLLCASFGWSLDPEWAADWASLRAAWRFKARPPAWLDTAGLDVACGDWRRFLPGAAAVVQRLGWQVQGNGAILARLDDSGTLRQCHLGWESFDVVKRWLVDHYKWQGVHSCGRIRNRGHRDDATLARGLSLGAPLRSARFALEGHRLAVAAEPTREVRLGSGGSIWYHCKRLEMSSPDTTACVCGLLQPSRAHLTWCCSSTTGLRQGLAPPSTRAGERLFAAEIPEYPAAPAASDFENTLQSIVAHLRNFATVGERLLIATDGSAKFDVGGCAVIFGSGDGAFVFGDACEDQSAFRCELLTLTTLFEAISRAQLAPGCQVGILVDCSSALQAVAQPEACSMPLLAHKAARLLRDVRAGGLDLKISWTPAHGRRPNWTAPWGLTADRCRDLNERADAAANSIREHRARGSGRVSWHAELHRAALWERGAILASAGASNVLAQHLRARRPARIIQDDPCNQRRYWTRSSGLRCDARICDRHVNMWRIASADEDQFDAPSENI
ncbi:unnamed protein product [Symbiodinium sp. CCMP2592]|nr:unnamed protein product [Symbiodinium sp. CCMP2592]